MRLFLFGLIAPFAGALLLRYGLVRMIAVSAVLIVIGLVMTITMTERWQLWLGTGVLLGIAPGMTALVVSATVASREPAGPTSRTAARASRPGVSAGTMPW